MPEEPRTTLYRLRRAAWGIWIELTASAVTTAAAPAHGERVSDGVWLDATPVLRHPPGDHRNKRLSHDEAAWLRHGLILAAPAVTAALPPGHHALVTVHVVRFPETDYQPEGLAAALLVWAEQEFGLPPHPIAAAFDRPTNRYVYDWGATARS